MYIFSRNIYFLQYIKEPLFPFAPMIRNRGQILKKPRFLSCARGAWWYCLVFNIREEGQAGFSALWTTSVQLFKKPRFLSCAKGGGGEHCLVLAYARGRRAGIAVKGQCLLNLPASLSLSSWSIQCHPHFFCANAKKSRPKTPFLKVKGRCI